MPLNNNFPTHLHGQKAKNAQRAADDAKLPEEKNMEAAQKNTVDFIKIIAATIKNQNPEKPADPGQIAQTIAVMKQTEEIIKMGGNITILKERLVSDELGRISSMYVGKNVHVNTSKQKFDGEGSVTFNYQINYDEAKKAPSSYVVSSISIYNGAGIEIYKTIGKREKGKHQFIWDGKDNKGKQVKKGEYTIKVNAHMERSDANGQLTKTPIECGSFITGTVDSVEMHGHKPKLLVEGVLFDLNQVIKISPDEKENPSTANNNLLDYSGLIGKIAEIKNNTLDITHAGTATIEFNCQIVRPGKTLVRLYDLKDNYVGCAVIEGAKEGINSLSFRPTNSISPESFESFEIGVNGGAYLPTGKYNYKIFIQNLASEESSSYAPLELDSTYEITGLDLSKEPIVICNDKTFKISDITKLHGKENSRFGADYANFLGKVANVNFDKIDITSNKTFEKRFMKIPYVDGDYTIKNVYMNIYDAANKNVAKIKSNTVLNTQANNLYSRETLLNYITHENLALLKSSLGIASECTNLDEIEEFFGQSEEGQKKFQNFANELFQKLEYETIAKKYWPNFDLLTSQDKSIVLEAVKANYPATGFYWNCRDFEGKKLAPGTYTYEFEIEKRSSNQLGLEGELVIEKIKDKGRVQISEYAKDSDGLIKFYGKPM
ncbi:MAG: FlgD immunoglobulin-like domain containing protein, partial [Rickettsiaceae bacterium]|nr:FlgD immunoglobulin-like domain containing protein [Rickettsiaceae bacterium]